MSTVTADYKGERVYVGFTLGLNLRPHLTLSIEPVTLSQAHAVKVGHLARQDATLSNIKVES
jgi:hypothetical protein